MTSTLNLLPILAFDARIRRSGVNVNLNNLGSGSFVIPADCSRYSIFCNFRSISSMPLVTSLTPTPTIATAFAMTMDFNTLTENLPPGTTVYWAVLNPMDLDPGVGGPLDYLYINYYG